MHIFVSQFHSNFGPFIVDIEVVMILDQRKVATEDAKVGKVFKWSIYEFGESKQ